MYNIYVKVTVDNTTLLALIIKNYTVVNGVP